MNNNKTVVLHILNTLLPSGAETMLVNSADEWKNCELHVLGTGKEIGNYKDEFIKAGYIVHHIYAPNFFKQHAMIRQFLCTLRPDVVHVHKESQECYYELDAKLTGVKNIVRTVHNVFSFTGLLRVRRIITRLVGRILGTRYVAISQSVYENEKNRFYNKPCILIDNWCDEEKYDYISQDEVLNQKMDLEISDMMSVISVGNCTSVKNHMFILKGLKTLVQDGHNLIHYYHVGNGIDTKTEEAYVCDNDLRDYVSFVGHINPIPYLQGADLFIMPSTYEGVGISAMEAMYTGIPCLLTRVNGLRDFESVGSKDIFFCNLNQDAFNKELTVLYEEFQKGKIVHSKELSDKVHKRYSRANSVLQYLNVYEGKL